MVKEGSIWTGSNHVEFIVLHRVVLDDIAWIHYRQNNKDNNSEYSCYEDSFVQRFTEKVR